MKKIIRTFIQVLLLPLAIVVTIIETYLDKVGNLGSLGYGIERYFKNEI